MDACCTPNVSSILSFCARIVDNLALGNDTILHAIYQGVLFMMPKNKSFCRAWFCFLGSYSGWRSPFGVLAGGYRAACDKWNGSACIRPRILP